MLMFLIYLAITKLLVLRKKIIDQLPAASVSLPKYDSEVSFLSLSPVPDSFLLEFYLDQ